jgi:hypothetical protein
MRLFVAVVYFGSAPRSPVSSRPASRFSGGERQANRELCHDPQPTADGEREAVGAAAGRVLEVGVGSGLKFQFYGKPVEVVFWTDPSPRLLVIAWRARRR